MKPPRNTNCIIALGGCGAASCAIDTAGRAATDRARVALWNCDSIDSSPVKKIVATTVTARASPRLAADRRHRRSRSIYLLQLLDANLPSSFGSTLGYE